VQGFDQALRGRADSLLGAVHDAEDVGDNVTVNPDALDLQNGDLWMVQDGRGPVLAHSGAWAHGDEKVFGREQAPHNLRIGGARLRGMQLHGVRVIDADDTNPGIPRPVTIFYAVSLDPVYAAMHRAERFLLLANGLLLLLTGLALTWLLRRGLAPLESLSLAAAEITPLHPRFAAPESALESQELAVLAGALESATRRLDEAFRQQQVFVHDAAHELKTAVTIVKSSLQLLASRPRTAAEYERGLELCLADCARMEDLVQKLLLLARAEQPREDFVTTTKIDVSECVREVAEAMESLASVRGVKLVVDSKKDAMARIAFDDCATVATNLMVNALQHTGAGGTVMVQVLSRGGMTVFRIEDNGEGIPAENLPHIFDRFYRGDPSRSRNTGGAGLGLAICQALVESAG